VIEYSIRVEEPETRNPKRLFTHPFLEIRYFLATYNGFLIHHWLEVEEESVAEIIMDLVDAGNRNVE
jgi:hypothetical protein